MHLATIIMTMEKETGKLPGLSSMEKPDQRQKHTQKIMALDS